jgi:CRISPR type IV-associated protein Csf2
MEEEEKRFTVYFDGTLTTITPFANSPEGNRGRNDEQLLPRLPINLGGTFKEVPIIPSATLRGKIRRAAARVLLDRFTTMKEPVGFDDWLLWALGGVKGTGDERLDVRRRASVIEGSALLAMFGAGESPAGGMVGARLHINPAIPTGDIPVAVVKGARAAENRAPYLIEIMPETEMDRVQAYTDANRDRSKLQKSRDALSKEIAKHEKAQAQRKPTASPEQLVSKRAELLELDDKLQAAIDAQRLVGSDNAIGRPLPGYEVIPARTELPHRMVIKAGTKEQIGFVLAALEEFALDPVIGAHHAAGCGRVAGLYDVKIRRGRQRSIEHVGRAAYGDLEGLSLDGDFLTECRAAWEKHAIDPNAYRAAA